MKLRTGIIIPIIACFLIIILTGHTRAKEPDLLPKAIIEQTTFAFSPVIAGTEVTHTFTINNKGETPLNIPGIYAEWGCLAVSYPRQIPPGGTGEITLKVKTDGKAGEAIRHHATVYTDDPNNATIELVLTGNVIAPAEINPKAARLIGRAGLPIRTEIKITPPALNPFDIITATAINKKHIAFHLEKKSNSEGPYFILYISNTKKDPGRYSDKIILTTTSSISPELTIRVYGLIRQ